MLYINLNLNLKMKLCLRLFMNIRVVKFSMMEFEIINAYGLKSEVSGNISDESIQWKIPHTFCKTLNLSSTSEIAQVGGGDLRYSHG